MLAIPSSRAMVAGVVGRRPASVPWMMMVECCKRARCQVCSRRGRYPVRTTTSESVVRASRADLWSSSATAPARRMRALRSGLPSRLLDALSDVSKSFQSVEEAVCTPGRLPQTDSRSVDRSVLARRLRPRRAFDRAGQHLDERAGLMVATQETSR